MRLKFLIIPSILIFQIAEAQNGTATITQQPATVTAPPQTTTASAESQPGSTTSTDARGETRTLIVDYKSVYEAATIEEEVKMATERFSLTPDQQDMWLAAAADRRAVEKQAYAKLDAKGANYEKEGVYRGLRTSLNNFHDVVTGHLNPAQKSALETDRLILEEKRKKLAMLPPPPPPAPTVTATPVDSAAIKKEEKGKKAKKKKKAVAQ